MSTATATPHTSATYQLQKPVSLRCPCSCKVAVSDNRCCYVAAAIQVLRSPLLPRVECDHSSGSDSLVTFESTLWGPTCDSADYLYKNVQLPELRNGDWLMFVNAGAYTVAGACDFNGIAMTQPNKYYVFSAQAVDEAEELEESTESEAESEEEDESEEGSEEEESEGEEEEATAAAE